MYYTYMIRCTDDSLYTGITTDLDRRLKEHISKSNKSAKYTRSHEALKFEAVWESESRALASKLEYHIKKLNKQQKEQLIINNDFDVFVDRLDKRYFKKLKCEV